MKMKKILLYTGVSVLALCGMTIGVAGFIAWTPPGQNFLRNTIADIANDTGMVQITDVTGDVLSDLHIGAISIKDKDGVWLDIRNAHLRWVPVRYLTGGQIIDVVKAEQIDVLRRPVSEKKKKPTEASSSGSVDMDLIAQILPKNVQVQTIRIHEDVGVDQSLNFTASGNAGQYAVHMKTIEGVTTQLDAVLGLRAGNIHADINLNEDAGGILNTMMQAPEGSIIALHAKAVTDAQNVLNIQQAEAVFGEQTVSLRGTYDWNSTAMDVVADFDLQRLESWHALTGARVSGGIKGQATAKGTPDAADIVLKASGGGIGYQDYILHDYTIDMQGQGGLKKDGPYGQAKTTIDGVFRNETMRLFADAGYQDQALHIESLTLDHGDATLIGSADMHTGSGKLDATLHAEGWNIQDFVPEFPLPGLMQAEISATGTLQNMDLDAQADIASDHGNSDAQITANIKEQKYISGSVEANLRHDAYAFHIKGNGAADEKQVTLDDFSLDGNSVKASGKLNYDIARTLVTGSVKAEAEDLKPLGIVIGQDIAGRVMLDVAFEPQSDAQNIKLNADIADFRMDGLRIDTLKAKTDGVVQEHVDISANLKGSFNQDAFDADVKASGKGWIGQPVEVRIATLRAHYAGRDIVLIKPAEFYFGDDRQEISDTQLRIGRGLVTAKGIVTAENVDAKATLHHVYIEDILPYTDYSGPIEGDFVLSGTVQKPLLKMTSRAQIKTGEYAVNANINATWDKDKLETVLKATSDRASLNGNITLNDGFSLLPFAVNIHEQTSMKGQMNAQMPLDMLNSFMWSGGHRVEGLLDGKSDIAGTVGNPQFNGVFNIKNASYDQVDSGVCLRNLNATIRGTKERISLENMQARDPKGKFMKANAIVRLDDSKAIDARVDFDHYRLFCGGLALGDVDGGITTKGTLRDMLIAGKLELGPLNIQIPGAQGGAAIPEVETVRMKPGQRKTTDTEPASVQRMNVVIDAPNRVFVRGRGLDAEFGGKIAITGFASSPVIEGRFAARRGKFQLLDRALKLNTAVIRFEGPIPPAPFLEIAAGTDVKGTKITVNLNGPVATPQLTLTSSPARPQDEVLALLLFGRELQSLSAYQAFKLAQAVRVLAGLDSGDPGVLDSARAALGLDTLDVGTDDDNNVSVSTGKYVTEKVYVGVQQGATLESRQVVSEIELTPSISAKTSVDGDGNQGVGMQWSYDY